MMKKFDPKAIKTIGVFVGEDLLGDGILKYPFICQLREAFPHAEITWIAGHNKSIYSSLLAPLISGKIDVVMDQKRIGSSWKELLSSPLKAFDLFINTHQSLKTTLLLKCLKHRYFIDPSYNFLFSDFKQKVRPKHLTDRLISLIPRRFCKKDYLVSINAPMEKEVTALFNAKKTYIALAPGAGQKKKQWPLENFINVALEQVEKNRVPVFLLGPGEAHLQSCLKEAIPESLFPLQENPEFLKDPLYTTAIAKHCTCAVANDSGTGHLLGLAHIPLISLFGPTTSDKLRPYTSKGITITAKEFGGTDMVLIPVENVLKKIEGSL
jgi:ADP-heptose:LPS heptosyltransferase